MLFIFSVILLLMFCFPGISIEGAKAGLLLWFNTVLPSIFPFLIITTYLTSHIRSAYRNKNSAKNSLKNINTARSTGSNLFLYICAILSGLPIGAKIAADSMQSRIISVKKAYFIFTALNNISPSFIFGYLAIGLFHSETFGIQLLITVLASSVISSIILYSIYGRKHIMTPYKPYNEITHNSDTSSDSDDSFNSAMLCAILTISKIGGFIILFSIANNFIGHFICSTMADDSLLMDNVLTVGGSSSILAGVASLLEITTGTELLAKSSITDVTKKALITAFVAFGGFSGLAQTYSVVNNTGLSMTYYFFVKLVAGIIALGIRLVLFI